MNVHKPRRRRAALAGVAVAGLSLSGTAVLGSGPSSAAVAGDCAVPFPVSELTDGQPVSGLTVSTGTTPDGFTGEVLGVLKDGIAVGRDMVMMRLTSPEIDRVGGIWQGMSGSPVYAEDGRLIGAVAYGLAWGPSPVAGVTPFEDMDDYLAPRQAARKVPLSKAEAADLAAEPGITQRQADQGFAQLRMPMTVSGVGARRIEQAAAKGKAYLGGAVRAAGATGAAPAAANDLVAGGNLGASVSYGDVLMGGVGTVTSVCNDEVVGFGHPFTFSGRTTLGLHGADAIYIQEDPVSAPFKVANFGDAIGTIDEDRGTGISGRLGATPPTSGITSSVSYGGNERTGSTYVELPDWVTDAMFYQVIANQDRVFDAIGKGGAAMDWTVRGTGPAGKQFTLRTGDRYVSEYDISFETPWDLADTVWALSSLPDVTVDEVTASTAMRDSSSIWALKRVEQRVDGEWVKVGRRLVAQGGQTLRLRAVLGDGVKTIRSGISLTIPRKLAGGRAELQVVGGGSNWSWIHGNTLAKVLNRARGQQRNDEVRWQLRGSGDGGRVNTTQDGTPKSRVIEGEKYLTVIVRR